MKPTKFIKDEILFHENDECKGVGIVLSGKIKIVSYSFSGREILYNQLSSGEMFGANLVFSSERSYRGNVVGESGGSYLYIAKQKLIDLLQSNRDFLLRFLEMQSDFGKELNRQTKILSFNSAEERLVYFLHVNGGETKPDSIASLARKLGLERETLSRLISSMTKSQRIEWDGTTIRLL